MHEYENKLNVGCGKDIRPKEEGWINLDSHSTYNADKIFDLDLIYDGKKMPFQNNTFDYVICSHVIEDFLNPVPVIDELIRVCKKEGEIDIRVPFETKTWTTNIYHKKPFTIGMFVDFVDLELYGQKRPIEIIEKKYYNLKGEGNAPFRALKLFSARLFNALGYNIVEKTFVKYLFPYMDIKIVFRKTRKNE